MIPRLGVSYSNENKLVQLSAITVPKKQRRNKDCTAHAKSANQKSTTTTKTNKQTKKTAHFKTAARPSNYKEFNFVIGTWRHAENLELQKED